MQQASAGARRTLGGPSPLVSADFTQPWSSSSAWEPSSATPSYTPRAKRFLNQSANCATLNVAPGRMPSPADVDAV